MDPSALDGFWNPRLLHLFRPLDTTQVRLLSLTIYLVEVTRQRIPWQSLAYDYLRERPIRIGCVVELKGKVPSLQLSLKPISMKAFEAAYLQILLRAGTSCVMIQLIKFPILSSRRQWYRELGSAPQDLGDIHLEGGLRSATQSIVEEESTRSSCLQVTSALHPTPESYR